MLSLNPVLFKKVWNLEYPINRVVEFQDNLDHSNYLGFTWALTHLDRFPKGRNTTTNAGTQGGEKTHVLTIAEMPIHTHTLNNGAGEVITNSLSTDGKATFAPQSGGLGHAGINSAGENQAHNNEPQFEITAYWKRTA